MERKIDTFIINLKQRTDRRSSVLLQFQDKEEFNVKIVEAKEHSFKAVSLWQTVRRIVKENKDTDAEFILICEDDHQFTESYNKDALFNMIQIAQEMSIDILCGGISWMNRPIQVSEHLFWVEKFTGLQFTIIFKSFFPKIMSAQFGENDVADLKISGLTDKKLVVYPFISTQKDFGYSDVTPFNNITGRVDGLFKTTSTRLEILSKIKNFYYRS
ncbi:hypothetical protein [Pedobacter frigoris]|uniref:hypothetical protein n=1 Tax=Pedobacter frigoris TaxID=2571272 RepID=UPI00292ED643|nr:hypothetical protein [Pedobacter frigoris]